MQAKKLWMKAPAESMQWSTLFERLCQALLMVAVLAIALWLGWGFGRGLELTDEAFYALNGMYPHALRFFFTPTQWLAAPLWALGGGLTGFRVVGWIVLTGSAALLACGAIRAARHAGMSFRDSRWSKSVAIAGSVVGAWLYGAILNFSPSYNSLSAAGAYLALGLFLLGTERPDRGFWKFQPAVVGVVLGLTVIAKFSTGICMIGIVLGLHVFIHRSLRLAVSSVAMLLAAAVFTVVAVAAVFSSPGQAWHAFRDGLTLTSLAQQNEPVAIRLSRNWEECKTLFYSAGGAFAGPLLCVALSSMVRRPLIAVVAAVWFAVNLARGDFLLGGMDRYLLQSIPLAATILAMLMLTIGAWVGSLRKVLLVAILFALPFLIALGTGNPLPFQIALSMASWGLLCTLLAGTVSTPCRAPALLFCLIFVGITASQIVSAGMRSPYRLALPLPSQTISVDVANLGRLHVDAETARFLEDVATMRRVCDVRPGAGFLGFYGLPGLALVLEAVPLETPWMFSEAFASAVLDHADLRAVDAALVAIRMGSDGTPPVLPKQLAGFPKHYRKCGATTLPFESVRVQLWAPIENGVRTSEE